MHPFASKHYRLPAHADNKTDDTDLEGIFRAAVNGFGLLEPTWDETYLVLQLLARQRRDLVEKRAKLQCQIRHFLDRCLPGYAALYPNDALWKRPTPMALARRAGSAGAILKAAAGGVTEWLRQDKLRCHRQTITRIVAWAGNAADADPLAEHLQPVWHALHDDWKTKTGQIVQIERNLAEILVKTPYILLLSQPGINVVRFVKGTGPFRKWTCPFCLPRMINQSRSSHPARGIKAAMWERRILTSCEPVAQPLCAAFF